LIDHLSPYRRCEALEETTSTLLLQNIFDDLIQCRASFGLCFCVCYRVEEKTHKQKRECTVVICILTFTVSTGNVVVSACISSIM
jgi:hypothetical protein